MNALTGQKGCSMKIDWQSDLKDAMWSMFWVARNQDGAGEPKIEPEDAESLKESVARLVKMTTQKTAGQRSVKSHLDWKSLDTVLMNIACIATRMCLDGVFGDMPKLIEGDPD